MKTQFHFLNVSELSTIVPPDNSIVITDKNVLRNYEGLLETYKKIVLDAGEEEKSFETLSYIIEQLIKLEADRTTTIAGIGGGVITDISGFAASVYMRGIPF